VDSSAALGFVKGVRLAEAKGFELVIAGASDRVREELRRGGMGVSDVVHFEPDLDRAMQRCEDALLEGTDVAIAADRVASSDGADEMVSGMPAGLRTYLERVPLVEGTVLIRQDEPPDDVFVLGSGRLGVELATPEGKRVRVRTIRPGVMVGEVAMYTGVPRTADVVAETPSVVLRLSRASIERIETEDPELAAALHRWLATTLAERLRDTLMAVDALLD
jgi:SulP family sulfate permease